MSRKNDFVYYQYSNYYDNHSYVVFAGGRLKIPVWLLWSTWGVIAGVVLILETVVGIVSGGVMYGPVWPITGILVLTTGGLVALFWILVGLVILVRAWINAFRAAR